jgi:hypothetical protein
MIANALAAAALLMAQPNQQSCITKEQAGDLAIVVLPDLVNSVAAQCAPHLPETAFLRRGATEFVQRLRTEAGSRRESALAAFQRFTNGRLPQGLSPEAALSGMSTGMLSGMSNRLNARTCPEVSRMFEALAPLPAANFAMLISSAVGTALAMRTTNGEAQAGQAARPGAAPAAGRGPTGPFCPQ